VLGHAGGGHAGKKERGVRGCEAESGEAKSDGGDPVVVRAVAGGSEAVIGSGNCVAVIGGGSGIAARGSGDCVVMRGSGDCVATRGSGDCVVMIDGGGGGDRGVVRVAVRAVASSGGDCGEVNGNDSGVVFDKTKP